MDVRSEYGTEMSVSKSNSPLSRLLEQFLKGAHFTCTLEGGYCSEGSWEQLATSKFGDAVGLARVGGPGHVIVLPQVSDKVGFISQLLTNVLPEIAPHLFPHIDRGKWTHLPEYELALVKSLTAKQSEVRARADAEVLALEEQIVGERSLNGWMHDLLTGTDTELVEAVKSGLAKLGFEKLVDVDEERDREGKARREDLQIHDVSPTLIVDIKGLGGHPSDDDAFQSQKHATLRLQEWKRFDVQGLTIINHQRYLPPLTRDNGMPFRQEILDFAAEMKMGLITTWDLYRFIRSALKWGWKPENTKPIIYGIGRIDPVPKHYVTLGYVSHVWTGAVSIQVDSVGLKMGDRIAFELDIEFDEQEVTSLQIDRRSVEEVPAGTLAGIETKLTRPSLREGMRVFNVRP